jgi:Protein of unknown function (DUF3485)
MRQMLPVAVAAGVLILTGVVHGLWTDRWARSQEAAAAAARLQDIRLSLGDWQGQGLEVEPAQVEGVSGYFLARYVNARDGSTALVFLVAGRPGPVAEHTPDVCYKASGYKVSAIQPYQPSLGSPAEFATALLLQNRSAERKNLRIYWAWSATGPWSAPDNPRLAFARYPALYKLYVIRDLSSTDQPVEDASCRDLLRQLLPELQRALFGASSANPAANEDR